MFTSISVVSVVAVVFAVLVFTVLVGVLVAGQFWTAPGELRLASGHTRNSSDWVVAADGTRLAVDVWLPQNLAPGDTVHAVVEGTRYWRDYGLTPFGRVAAMFGMRLPGVQPPHFAAYFTYKGYAFVTVDVRGTGASYGAITVSTPKRKSRTIGKFSTGSWARIGRATPRSHLASRTAARPRS